MTPLPRFAARTAVTTAALALLAPAVALPSQASPAGDSLVINEAYTCLLYTSPSPRDKRQSRMPSSA